MPGRRFTNPATDGSRVHVLVVDDSAVMRRVMDQLLASVPLMTVDTAADPLIALRKMELRRPDVILLDLEMPRMSGLAFLRRLMAEDPTPVVVFSSHAARGTETALRALEEGAVEVLAKPEVGLREYLDQSGLGLVDTLRAVARARVRGTRPRRSKRTARTPALRPDAGLWAGSRPDALVVVGASTGGPQALAALLAKLPEDGPPLAVVQHMPAGFTAAFARRLDAICPPSVAQAEDGDLCRPGRVLIAPGGRHLVVERHPEGFRARLLDGPPVTRHRPSIDVLFGAAARCAGNHVVGVLLTGMGRDGAEGLLALHQAGAATLAQDERSCVVFGMPREAIRLGAAGEVLSLSQLPGRILALTAARAEVVPPQAEAGRERAP